jgi:hypothetical protein
MSRRQQLALRHAVLLARSAALRTELAQYGAQIGAHLSLVDRGLKFAKAATERPILMTAAGLLLMLFKPTRALKWVARGALATSLLRRLLDFMEVGGKA